MARVKRGVTSHRRHKRLMQDAEGRKGTKSRLVKPARASRTPKRGGGASRAGLTRRDLVPLRPSASCMRRLWRRWDVTPRLTRAMRSMRS